MGPLLMLSWLVRLNFGVNIGKLTPTGRLRGTNLELKGALKAPQEAPKVLCQALTQGQWRLGGGVAATCWSPESN